MTERTVLQDRHGRLAIEELGKGRRRVTGTSSVAGIFVPKSPIVTDYPLELIRALHDYLGSVWTCDEISRDIDPTECALDIRYSVESYFTDSALLRAKRILDYGCGSGASTINLARMFPGATIAGLDMVEELIALARMRVKHYGLPAVSFAAVSRDGIVPGGSSQFDLVFLNAVYEHLLPSERMPVLQTAWASLVPGGSLIINQTPHRWFPIETHTSGLPLVNYLPSSIAHSVVRRFSARGWEHSSWDELLRAGMRGASVTSIMRTLTEIDPNARRLCTVRIAPTWAGIWFAAKRARLGRLSTGAGGLMFAIAERLVNTLRLPISPFLNIAIQKPR